MRAYFTAQLIPQKHLIEQTYLLWREIVGEDCRPNIDANKLGTVRRNIINNKRLNDAQIEQVRAEVRTNEENDNGEEPIVNAVIVREPVVRVVRLTNDEIDNMIRQVRRDDNGTNQGDFYERNREEIELARENILRELSKTKYTAMSERETLPKLSTNNKTRTTITLYNVALRSIVAYTDKDITSLNNLLYATARAVTLHTGIKIKTKKKSHINKQPKWKANLQKEIDSLRAEISILDELSKGINVNTRKSRKLKRKFNIVNQQSITTTKENLKQKMQVKAQRLRRFDKRNKFFRQNKIFQTDAKKFYRELGKSKIEIEEPPKTEEMEEFWKKIWENEKNFNSEAEWIGREEERMSDVREQEWEPITVKELQIATGKSQKWKSPGVDKIPNFWLNFLTELHDDIVNSYNDLMQNPEKIPEWLTEGTTYLLPKSQEFQNPKNYRPITCLTTTYKILTSIITERVYTFLENNSILPGEQKGCKRNSYGCKDQLLINKMLLENCRSKKRNMSTAWIDYKKAFDSVPHDWILKTLDMYKVSPFVTNFLRSSMSKWKTRLFLTHSNGMSESDFIKIKRGIFQGDSLSPLLFCISLIPLTSELNNSGSGYPIFHRVINHLFYMDDLKLFAKNDQQLEGLLTTVSEFSKDICMEFGLDKCAKATFVKGKLKESDSIIVDLETAIKELDPESSYKYLGVNEGDGIEHASMKEKIRKEYYRRIRLVLKTELNSKNRIEAINTLAIPVVQYSFNIINWNMSDILRMDRKTRKLLTSNRSFHPKADVDRLYLPRKEGGRGLMQLELSFKTTTIAMKNYLEFTNDWMMQLVLQHENSKKLHSVFKEAKKFENELNIQPIVEDDNLHATKVAKKAKESAKRNGQNKLAERYSQKALHGQYVSRYQSADVDQQATHQWLRGAGLKAETEGFITAAQDQSLFTRNYQANVLKNGADPKCRFCDKFVETIDHLVAGCPVLTPSEYVRRHDRVGQYLHWGICKHYGIDTHRNWYEHHPQPVTESQHVTILWDFSVNTDRTIQANRPDIIIKDHKNKTCLLIDMSVPSDKNIAVKEFDKLSKYKDLEIEIEKMWNLKATTVPVIVGALGMIKKGTAKFVEKIPGQHSLCEIQKIVLNSTAHILRKCLSI